MSAVRWNPLASAYVGADGIGDGPKTFALGHRRWASPIRINIAPRIPVPIQILIQTNRVVDIPSPLINRRESSHSRAVLPGLRVQLIK